MHGHFLLEASEGERRPVVAVAVGCCKRVATGICFSWDGAPPCMHGRLNVLRLLPYERGTRQQLSRLLLLWRWMGFCEESINLQIGGAAIWWPKFLIKSRII